MCVMRKWKSSGCRPLTDGSALLTIFGRHFGVAGKASVAVGGAPCAIPPEGGHVASSQATQVVCRVPEGEGLGKPVQLSFAGRTSLPDSVRLDYEPPTVSSILPAVLATDGRAVQA